MDLASSDVYTGMVLALGFDPVSLAQSVAHYTLDIGFLAFLVGLTAMVFWHEFGHWASARKFGIPVRVFSIGFFKKPRISFTIWGTRFQITLWLAGGYVDINPNSEEFRAARPWRRAVVLAGGPFMNLVLAFVLMASLYATIGHPVASDISITQVPSQTSPAAQAGIQPGDHFLTVDGIKPTTAGELIGLIHKHADGSPVHLVLRRGDQTLTLDVKPGRDGTIGVALAEQQIYQRLSVPAASAQALGDVWTMSTGIVSALGSNAKRAVITATGGASQSDAPQLHGMLVIIQVAVIYFHMGLFPFLWLMANISVNLAIINLLPIVPLDGGHLLNLAIEKILGRPLSEKAQMRMALIGFMLVMSLAFYALGNDILHPLFSH